MIKTKLENRKELTRVISEFTSEPVKYMGPPSFAYTVGNYMVDRDGTVAASTAEAETELKNHLRSLELLDEEPVENPNRMDIAVPANDLTGGMLRSLVFMVHSKQYLLNKVTGEETFIVPDALVDELIAKDELSKEDFMAAISRHEELKGLAFDGDNVVFNYPIAEDGAKNKAYAEVSAFIVSAVRHAKRVSQKEQKPENEKYYLRVWLLRLGLGGLGGKESRKALLQGLKGHTAFRTPEDAERHKERLAARKAEAAALEGKNDEDL